MLNRREIIPWGLGRLLEEKKQFPSPCFSLTRLLYATLPRDLFVIFQASSFRSPGRQMPEA
jgi:hypothetical protein